jgi:hypothetical protein
MNYGNSSVWTQPKGARLTGTHTNIHKLLVTDEILHSRYLGLVSMNLESDFVAANVAIKLGKMVQVLAGTILPNTLLNAHFGNCPLAFV